VAADDSHTICIVTKTTDQPAATDVPAILLAGVSLTYPAKRRQPGRTALDHVHLRIESGQQVALLGPNGSGKSTLLKIISSILASDGEHQQDAVQVLGYSAPAQRRRQLGIVFQSPSLDPHMTVLENLRDHAVMHGLRGNEAQKRIDKSLDRAGLIDRRDDLVKTLSLGLARRVDLCRALLHNPSLLLLDEPTVGLDPTSRAEFLNQLDQQHEATGLTVLMSTHLMDEADRQQRVVLMHEGRIVADDAPARLRNNLGTMLISIDDRQWAPPANDTRWQRIAGHWSMTIDHDTHAVEQVLRELTSRSIAFTYAPPTLADVFEHFTGQHLDQPPITA